MSVQITTGAPTVTANQVSFSMPKEATVVFNQGVENFEPTGFTITRDYNGNVVLTDGPNTVALDRTIQFDTFGDMYLTVETDGTGFTLWSVRRYFDDTAIYSNKSIDVDSIHTTASTTFIGSDGTVVAMSDATADVFNSEGSLVTSYTVAEGSTFANDAVEIGGVTYDTVTAADGTVTLLKDGTNTVVEEPEPVETVVVETTEVEVQPEVIAQEEVSAQPEVIAQEEVSAQPEVIAQEEVSAQPEMIAQEEVSVDGEALAVQEFEAARDEAIQAAEADQLERENSQPKDNNGAEAGLTPVIYIPVLFAAGLVAGFGAVAMKSFLRNKRELRAQKKQ